MARQAEARGTETDKKGGRRGAREKAKMKKGITGNEWLERD